MSNYGEYRIVNVSIDLETTGFDEKKNEIIQLAAVEYDKKTLKPRPFYTSFYIKPQRPQHILPAAMELNKIDLEKIPKENTPEKMKKDFIRWINSLSFPGEKIKIRPLGHNYSIFDILFLREWLTPDGYQKYFHHRLIDTCSFARVLRDTGVLNIDSCSLGSLCKHYDLGEPPHEALEDCYLALGVYRNLVKEMTPNKQLTRGLKHYLNLLPDFIFGSWEERNRV